MAALGRTREPFMRAVLPAKARAAVYGFSDRCIEGLMLECITLTGGLVKALEGSVNVSSSSGAAAHELRYSSSCQKDGRLAYQQLTIS
jgi:hypothetical protein